MYSIVDVETTGANRSGQKITEISIIRTDGSTIIDSFSSLINPERKIPLKITYRLELPMKWSRKLQNSMKSPKDYRNYTRLNIYAHNVFDYQFLQRSLVTWVYL